MKKALGFDRFDPWIAIQNGSTVVKDADVQKVIPALQKQLDRDFAPAWGLRARLVFGAGPKRAMKVILKDVSDEAGDLGYHFVAGYPVTYVFAKDDLEALGEFTSTLSHEILEMVADPGVNLYALGFVRGKNKKKSQAWVSYEVCDAVQNESYAIDGVKVSDFVLPEWFEPEHADGAMKMDFRGAVNGPFELASGGYADMMVAGHWKNVYGRTADRKRVRHRLLVRMRRLGLAA